MRAFSAKLAVEQASWAVLKFSGLMSRSWAVPATALLVCGASFLSVASDGWATAPGREPPAWLVAQGGVNPDKQPGPPINVDDKGAARMSPAPADPTQQAGTRGCYFLLDCPDITAPMKQLIPQRETTPGPACDQPLGSHVIVNVPWQDADNGLLLRTAPSMQAQVLSVVPADGVGLIVSSCSDGWCQIEYNCKKGYAAAKYVAERASRFRNVTNVSPSDPDGLNVRNGPGASYTKLSSIPHNGKQVIVHNCQTVSGSSWCLVTYQSNSGWVAKRYLNF